MTQKVLFVCLGNICRSPAAEGVARILAADYPHIGSLESAGTGNWHVGEAPHAVMRRVAKEAGYPIDDLRARQVSEQDFRDFDWIVAMDTSNLADLKAIQKHAVGAKARCILLLDPDLHGRADVPDPYYGGEDSFRSCFDLIRRGVSDFLDRTSNGIFAP